jgi:hypothetical protein
VGQGHRRSSNGRLVLAADDGHDRAGVFVDLGPVDLDPDGLFR